MLWPQVEYELGDGYRNTKPLSDLARTAFAVIRIAPATQTRYKLEARGVVIGFQRRSSSSCSRRRPRSLPAKVALGAALLSVLLGY